MKLVQATYTWRCSCLLEIEGNETPQQIREMILDAAAEGNENIEEGPNDLVMEEVAP